MPDANLESTVWQSNPQIFLRNLKNSFSKILKLKELRKLGAKNIAGLANDFKTAYSTNISDLCIRRTFAIDCWIWLQCSCELHTNPEAHEDMTLMAILSIEHNVYSEYADHVTGMWHFVVSDIPWMSDAATLIQNGWWHVAWKKWKHHR